MTATGASCPNCGAAITFRWSSAVQTTCSYCRSILVRHDVDLEKVGEVGDLPPDSSPIQIGTTGTFGEGRFTVIGRIIYEYERGSWNEWYVRLDDSAGGWLSDAMAEYAVSREAHAANLPSADGVRVGQTYPWEGRVYEVATLTKARYRGTEGELPFESWDKHDAMFVDLTTNDEHFATLDYSDGAPVLYLGEYMDFDALKLQNLRRIDGW